MPVGDSKIRLGHSKKVTRRAFLKGAVLGTGTAVSAPYIRNARAANTTVWKIQTSWSNGIGLDIFRRWCNNIVEKTGGELAFEPFGANELVGDFQLFEAVQKGFLDAMNPFTIYWAGRMPAAVFLSSYPLGLRQPHEWDVFYYGLNGLKLARELFWRFGLHYVGPIHHGPNIIHSKVPIRSVADFAGRKIRVPGGMVAELFQKAGAETKLMPGSEVLSALKQGTVDVADYVGPAINYTMGLHQVTDYICLGPPGFMSIYQPVDLMDFTVRRESWERLSDPLKQFVEMEVQVYSNIHHATIQSADQQAWKLFQDAGVQITRLSEDDVAAFTKLAVPLWFKWANTDVAASRIFKIQLDYMLSGSLGYVTPEMIKGQRIKT